MEIRHIWTKEDIKVGMFIIRNSGYPLTNISFSLSVSYQITWECSRARSVKGRTNNYGITSLSDGWTTFEGWGNYPATKEGLAEAFNNDDFGFRPLEKNEVIEIINYKFD